MNEQEKMDDLLRSKFEEREFPFDEENWEKAEELIIVARKKEKRRRFGFIFFFGIGIGALLMLPFINKKSENSQIAVHGQKAATVEKVEAKRNEEKALHAVDTQNQAGQNSRAVHNVVADTEVKTRIANQDLSVKAGSNPDSEEQKNTTETKSIPAAPMVKKKSEEVGISYDVKTVKKEKKKKEPITDETVVSIPAVKSNTRPVKSVDLKAPVETAIAKEPALTEVATKTTKNAEKAAEPKEQETKLPAEQPNLPVKAAKDSLVKATGMQANIKAVLTARDTVKQSKDTTSPANEIAATAKKDTVVDSLRSKTQTPEIAAKTNRPWTLSLEAGINYGGLYGRITPVCGINITKALTASLEIGTGIYYEYFNTKDEEWRSLVTPTYDFGLSYNETMIHTDKVHYIFAPLFAKYNFNQNNALVFGANFFYLFNTTNTIEYYNGKVEKTSGYFSEFNTTDVGVMLGYKRRIYKNLGMVMYLNWGLTRIHKETPANVTGNTTSAQVVLTYKLFK